MLQTLIELVVAPALVGASTLVGRRWGTRTGGWVSAFPAVVGPVLLVLADKHGAAFASRAAGGTLLGLVALSAFALAYGTVAGRGSWGLSLAAGWGCAAGLAALVAVTGGRLGFAAALACATISLLVANLALFRWAAASRGGTGVEPSSRFDVQLRMAMTAGLVVALTVAANILGPLFGGVLAALPILASVLAVFTQRQQGSAAVVILLRGMLSGMAGFVGFCAVIAGLIVPVGIAPTFAVATLVALILQTATLYAPVGRQRRACGRRKSPVESGEWEESSVQAQAV